MSCRAWNRKMHENEGSGLKMPYPLGNEHIPPGDPWNIIDSKVPNGMGYYRIFQEKKKSRQKI